MQSAERDQLFLNVASLFAKHSTCLRGNTGAVIAVHNRIVATGYNGAPPGLPHCKDVGCGGAVTDNIPELGEPYFPRGCTRATHAEANAVAFCARHGTPCANGTMYCTHSPCVACSHLMASAGIYRVVFGEHYRITEGMEMLRELGMVVDQVG